jgi:hypothetical protein
MASIVGLNHCPIARGTGPVHRWVGTVESVVGVYAPLVWPCRFANDWILVEGEQVLVLQDIDLFLGDVGQIRAHEERAFHHRPQRKVGMLLFDRETVADLDLSALSFERTWSVVDSTLPQACPDHFGPRNRYSRAGTS